MYPHMVINVKYIVVRNTTNLQVHLLFLAAGLLEDKFTLFCNPLLCLKQDDFKITQTDERKDTKDYIKVKSGLKNRFLV